MSTPKRRQPAAVIARLLAEPHKFGFMQAVRLLDRWFSQRDRAATGNDSMKPGLSKRLFFRNTLSLSFPASEIADLKIIEAVPQVATQEAPTAVSVANSPLDPGAAPVRGR